MRQLVITAALVLTQVVLTSCEGHFYVGLLGYTMPEGQKCCEEGSLDLNCTQFCHLIFDIEIHGLSGSGVTLRKRLSPTAISPADAVTFPSNSPSNHLMNPMTFNFFQWPGSVNVSVLVYDQGNVSDPFSTLLIDQFSEIFTHYVPANFYIQRDLDAVDSKSTLTVIFRYSCGLTKGPECFTDCVDHDENETCPMTSPIPLSPEVTFTGFVGNCETVDIHGMVVHRNCTTDSTPKPPQNSTHTKYLDSGPTQSPKPKNSSSSSPPEVTSEETTTASTKPSVTSTSTRNIIKTTSSQTNISTVRKSDDPGASRVTSSPAPSSTPDERSTKTDDDGDTIKYWPAIVGGVLGGVAFIAAIGFCLYYRRQKKMQKRQEIYNVNPKVLRNFEEFAENGTSGRADVPLETEQY